MELVRGLQKDTDWYHGKNGLDIAALTQRYAVAY